MNNFPTVNWSPCVFLGTAVPQQKKHQDFLQRPPAFSSLLRDLGLIESEVRADAVAEAGIGLANYYG